MGKNNPKQSRPYDGRPPRSKGSTRRAGAGIGPGPAYRPSSGGGGTKHGSSTGTRAMVIVAALIFGLPVAGTVALGAVVYL